MNAKRTEHPNPQFKRESWVSLNGTWEFEFEEARDDFRFSESQSEIAALYKSAPLRGVIEVPFCVQSSLSGVAHTGFVNIVRYRRTFPVRKDGRRVFLHVGAADYLTSVFVNGALAGRHRGGYTSFCFEITHLVTDGENELYILCEDNERDPLVPRGKQCESLHSRGCDYTRTTGIWQSVWLEYTPQSYLESFRLYPDLERARVKIRASFCQTGDFSCEAFYHEKSVGSVRENAVSGEREFVLELSETHPWEVGNGELYQLKLQFGEDLVTSYFGLREVRLENGEFLLNGKSVFQALVLDQGFYPDGIYTAPSEEAMINDILLSQSLGFNGARLHEKVFEPLFLYHCDRLGYLVWGEMANWGLDHSAIESLPVFLDEWKEALHRDFNHPAIIGWCPFNETWNYKGRRQNDEVIRSVYEYTKGFDPTRPCIDTSGNYHVKTDIYDIHDYDQDPESFKAHWDLYQKTKVPYDPVNKDEIRQTYRGEPVFISEYGGIKLAQSDDPDAWGYGKDAENAEEFIKRYAGLTGVIRTNGRLFGFCYTQLYDIEQEQNGLYTYDRKKKFDDAVYAAIKQANTGKE